MFMCSFGPLFLCVVSSGPEDFANLAAEAFLSQWENFGFHCLPEPAGNCELLLQLLGSIMIIIIIINIIIIYIYNLAYILHNI